MTADWKKCPCGKRGYAGADEAKAATSRAGNRIRCYRCPDSQLVHVTDSDKTQRCGKPRQVTAKHRQQRRTRRRKARSRARQACRRWA